MEYNDLILDMLNRIVKLEKEVEQLKKEKEASFEEAPVPARKIFCLPTALLNEIKHDICLTVTFI